MHIKALDIGTQLRDEGHGRAGLTYALRLAPGGVQRRAIGRARLVESSRSLEDRATASQPAVLSRCLCRYAVEPGQGGVVSVQPQFEIDRLEFKRDDGAQAGDPFIEAVQRLIQFGWTQARDRAGTLAVHVGEGPCFQSAREVTRGGSCAPDSYTSAGAHDQRVSVPGLARQKPSGRIDGCRPIVRIEEHMRANEARCRERRIDALGTIEIRERLCPLAGLTIELRSPDKKVRAGGVSCKLCGDSGDSLGKPVVGGGEWPAQCERHRESQYKEMVSARGDRWQAVRPRATDVPARVVAGMGWECARLLGGHAAAFHV